MRGTLYFLGCRVAHLLEMERLEMERYTPLAAEFGPEGKLCWINKSSEAATGVGARSAPLIVTMRSK